MGGWDRPFNITNITLILVPHEPHEIGLVGVGLIFLYSIVILLTYSFMALICDHRWMDTEKMPPWMNRQTQFYSTCSMNVFIVIY